MQSVVSALYPPQCMACGEVVAEPQSLCGACWQGCAFIEGTACRICGAPLPGEEQDARGDHCDDCLKISRPWRRGAAVMTYRGTGRRLVMALKHGDRQDLARPLARWLAARLRNRLAEGDVVVPVPIHWRRMLRRRFNQSALIAQEMAAQTGARFVPDVLYRRRHTKPQDRLTMTERFALQAGTIAAHPTRAHKIAGRRVVIVDDVMTSGATLAATAAALLEAQAREVEVAVLARVVKDG